MKVGSYNYNKNEILLAIRDALVLHDPNEWENIHAVTHKVPYVLMELDAINVAAPRDANLISGFWCGVLGRAEDSSTPPKEYAEIGTAMIYGIIHGAKPEDEETKLSKIQIATYLAVMMSRFISGSRWHGDEWEGFAKAINFVSAKQGIFD